METIHITSIAGSDQGAANDDIPPVQARRLVKRLEQRVALAGIDRALLLYECGLLGIDRGRGGGDERVLKLGFIDPDPRVSWRIPTTLWASILVMAVAAFVMRSLNVGYVWLLLVVIAVAVTALAIWRTRKVYRFVTAGGASPVLELVAAIPDARSCSIFLSQLRLSIEHARWDIEKGRDGTAAAVAEHRRLMEIGVLSDKRYEAAKARLLQRYNDGNQPAPPAIPA